MSRIKLNSHTASEIIDLIKGMPASTSLTFEGINSFNEEDWKNILAVLPRSITSLGFHAIGENSLKALAPALSLLGQEDQAAQVVRVGKNIDSLEFIVCDNGEAIIELSSAFPKTVTTLNLTNCPFPNYPDDATANAVFARLSPAITSLGIRSRSLSGKDDAQLTRILAALPLQLKELDLSENHLGNFHRSHPLTAAGLIQAITAIQAPLAHLSLANNELLRGITVQEATNLGVALSSKNLSSLDLSHTQFLEHTRMAQALFAALHITRLNMQDSRLQLGRASFKDLPQKLETLDYRSNSITVEDLEFLQNPPPNLAVIALNYSDFSRCKPETLFAALPKTLSTLILSDRDFMPKVSLADFISIVQKIPPNIKTLDLSNNELERFSLEELKQLIAAIPPHVEHIILDNNLLFYKETTEVVLGAFGLMEQIRRFTLEEVLDTLGPMEQRTRFSLEDTGFDQLKAARLPIAMMVGSQLPIELWTIILSYVIATPNKETNDPSLIKSMQIMHAIKQETADKGHLQLLQAAITTAKQNYTNYVAGVPGGSRGQRSMTSTLFSYSHPKAEQDRIRALEQTVLAAQTANNAVQLIEDFLNKSSNKFDKHSPESYVVDQIVNIQGLEHAPQDYPKYSPYKP